MSTHSRPIETLLTPFRNFLRSETLGSVLLILTTSVALIWANSPWAGSYRDLWHAELVVRAGHIGLSMSLAHWINDGLMAIFFLVVGLEIKREVLVGELASPRQAALPLAAAVGGSVAPALIYLTLNMGTPASRGWGIPMATDIAFALGVLALLGARVPVGLKVFLTALAIVDDLIAVLVIALFYTSNLSWPHLLAALGALLLLVAVNQAHVRSLAVYLLLGVGLWVALLNSGVHATIAGVLVAMTIPARTRLDTKQFMQRTAASLKAFQEANASVSAGLTGPAHQAALQDLTTAAEQVQSPMQRLEHALHPWTAYVIVPIFALANAGVTLGESALQSLTSAVGLGIALGLVVGKQVGITLGAWAMVRVGLAALPEGVTWRHLYGVSWLGGIGFTMSLFIADLAFSNESVIAMAKVGILSASLVAGCTGWLLLRGLPSRLEPS